MGHLSVFGLPAAPSMALHLLGRVVGRGVVLSLFVTVIGPGCVVQTNPAEPPDDLIDPWGDPVPDDDDDSTGDDDDSVGDDDDSAGDDDDSHQDDDDSVGDDDDSDAPPTDPCDGLGVCDGFESSTAGSSPDPALWSLETPNCSGDGQAIVDGTVAHSGQNSVRFEGSGGYCNHIFIAPTDSIEALGDVLYARFYVRFGQALGPEHVTFAAFADQTVNKDIRMGGQSEILMWNRELDDATLPVLSPSGIALSLAPVADAWTCIEFAIDGPAGTLDTWVDSEWVEGLQIDGVSSPDVDAQWHNGGGWFPELVDARFGWESYGGSPANLWFDDIALSNERIGCID